MEPDGNQVALGWVVDQFEGHELVAGKLQSAELGLWYCAQHLVPEGGVELERPLQVGDPGC